MNDDLRFGALVSVAVLILVVVIFRAVGLEQARNNKHCLDLIAAGAPESVFEKACE